jgi:2-keto-3-deoxy-L-rhamnonate aldolase RhmA
LVEVRGDVDAATRWFSEGVDMVVISSDLGLMARRTKESLSRLEVLLKILKHH